MKKALHLCTVIVLSFCLLQAKAQTDTTKYDLGRLQMDKKLTQAITIKAADLEKMPFSSLADAINVWIYGVYGNHPSYVPVIDGIVMNDVNALSIYDIDEITLVQNASAVLNGASPQQFLLLIKTRRNRSGKSGVEVAGQTNLIKHQGDQGNGRYNTRVYDQYYLSGYVNTSNIHAGLSADLQRDATPLSMQSSGINSSTYTEALTRYKLNGYLDANLGNSSTLSISAGFVPQNGDGLGEGFVISSSGNIASSTVNTLKEHLYYNNISLKSSFSGFKNTLTGGYQHLSTTNSNILNQALTIGSNSYSQSQNTLATYNNNNVAIKDNLSYAFKSGNWNIEPNINFMYRHFKSAGTQSLEYVVATSGGTPIADTTATANNNAIVKQSLLTPALNINYGKVLMFQGGFQVMLAYPANSQGFKPKRAYPFASVMLNVIDKQTHSTGLSVFGSFANVNSYMGDISNYIAYSSSIAGQFAATTYYSPDTLGNVNPYNNFNQWQAGANFSMFNNKLLVSYNFSHQQFNSIQTGSGYYYSYIGTLYLHRFGFDINWAKTDKFSLETNLNASFIKGLLYANPTTTATHRLTTGGFINRLNYKKAFLGADVLYVLHDQTSYTTGSTTPPNNHGLNLQNLYAGFKVNVRGTKNLEIYANARSIAQTKNSTILDTRKYYGLGFKLGL